MKFKNIHTKILVISLLVLYSFNAFSQIRSGDDLSNHILPKIINADYQTKQLSEFKGKFVILDLWGPGCASCIEEIPRMQRLQDEFGDRIQIILVDAFCKINKDTDDKILGIFKRMEKRLGISMRLPCVMNDDQLDGLYYGVNPLNSTTLGGSFGAKILIGPDGKVLDVTSSQFVNSYNLNRILKGEKVDLPTYVADDRKFMGSTNVPVFFLHGDAVKGDTSTRFHSEIIQGVMNPFFGYKEINGNKNLYYGKSGQAYIFALYRDCRYSEVLPPNIGVKFVYKLKNAELRHAFEGSLPISANGTNPNYFAYDIYSSIPITEHEINSRIRNALDATFGKLYFTKTKTLEKFLTIKSNSNIATLYSKGGDPMETIGTGDRSNEYATRKYVRNLEIGILLEFIANKYGLEKLENHIDETNVKQNIDFELPPNVDLSTKDKVVAYCKTIGLELNETTKQVDAVLVTDEQPKVGKLPKTIIKTK